MGAQPLPDPEYLRKVLRYEPEAGHLYWLPRGVDMFSDGKRPATWAANIWAARFSGKRAFTAIGKRGYHFGRVGARVCTAHRVIWAVQTGKWPDGEIDHINGDKLDNRWENLRDVSTIINARNRGPCRAKSGQIGVHWRDDMSKWTAYITINYKTHYLGSFADMDSAIAARKAAERGLGFTERHGKV